MDVVGIIAVLSSLVGIPLIVFGFIYLNIKGKRAIEMEILKKETLQIELEREKTRLKMLEAENIRYDRIIDDRDR